MKNIFKHIRMYFFRGLLAVTPLLLCAFAIQLLYVLIDKRMMVFLSKYFDVRQIPGLGILLVLVSLYLIGLVASSIIGRQIFILIENITERIPFIKAIYALGKQLSHSLSIGDEDKKAFKKAVLVDIHNNDIWSLGFVTGYVNDSKTQEELYMVFIPTVPNPTTGFVFVVKPSQVVDPGWSIEECLKAIVSAGIITPKEVRNLS